MRNDVIRKGLVLGILLLFVTVSIVSALNANPSSNSPSAKLGNWLYVGGIGPGNYTTIQSAIDASISGDTVFVFSGTYYENIVISKDSISLIGEDKHTTIIDGRKLAGGLTIPENCDYNFVSDFTIKNASHHGICIHSETAGSGATCNYNTISDCIVIDSVSLGDHAAIVIMAERWTCHADYNTIINCEVYNNIWTALSVCLFPKLLSPGK